MWRGLYWSDIWKKIKIPAWTHHSSVWFVRGESSERESWSDSWSTLNNVNGAIMPLWQQIILISFMLPEITITLLRWALRSRYSKRHPLSLDPRSKWGKTCQVDAKTRSKWLLWHWPASHFNQNSHIQLSVVHIAVGMIDFITDNRR